MSLTTTFNAIDVRTPASPRWPLFLWLLQLVVPLSVLAFGWLRHVNHMWLDERVTAALVACGLWAVGVIAFAILPRTRQWLQANRYQLALLFGSAVFALVVCDVALSLTGIVPSIAERRAESLEYQPTAFTRHRLVAKQVMLPDEQPAEINDRGYLGKEITLPKPAGTTRIAFLGGSQVYSVYWCGKDWPTQVGEILRQDGLNVDVINAGIPNHQTGDAVGKLFADLWTTEPDIVVLCNTWNDLKYFAELTPDRPYLQVAAPGAGKDRRLHPVGVDWLLCYSACYRVVHSTLITTILGAGDEGAALREPVMKMTDVALRQYRLNVQTVCDIGNNIGAQVVLCKQARLPVPDSPDEQRDRIPYSFTGLPHDELIRAFAECDRVMEEVAGQKQCPVIDMNAALSGKAEWFADHIHFNPEGSREAARIVAEQLRAMIGEHTQVSPE
jgi:hypothetical protein